MAAGSIHEDLGRKEKVSIGSNRTFGLVTSGVLAALGLLPLIHGGPPRPWLLGVVIVVLMVAFIAPKLLSPLNLVWFWIGMLLSLVVSPIVMMVLFFVTITPVGIAVRWSGRDLLRLRRRRDVSTYWIERAGSSSARETLKNQF